jgi:tripartite-type tricarboxylate transporter receptor subunit TctC
MKVMRLMKVSTAALALLASWLAVCPASAQSVPSGRIQILVPFPAGTVLDTLARVVAEEFSADFGQPVVVVNRPGAAGTLAFGDIAAAPPDGSTLMFSGQTQLTIQPHVKADLPYRVESIAPICQMFETPFALVVGPQSPFQDFRQFAEHGRAQPRAVRFGHFGQFSVTHMLGVLLMRAAGFEMTDVPYRLLGDQVKDVIGGTIDAGILSIGSFSPATVRVIAVFNRRRSVTFPDKPTVTELGYPLPLRSINGLFASASMPKPLIERLQASCTRAFASDKFREMAGRLDVNAELVVGDEFARRLDDERRAMKLLVDQIGRPTN